MMAKILDMPVDEFHSDSCLATRVRRLVRDLETNFEQDMIYFPEDHSRNVVPQ